MWVLLYWFCLLLVLVGWVFLWIFRICPFTLLTIKLKSLAFYSGFFPQLFDAVVSYSVYKHETNAIFFPLTHHHNHKKLYARRFYFVGFHASVLLCFQRTFFLSLSIHLFSLRFFFLVFLFSRHFYHLHAH